MENLGINFIQIISYILIFIILYAFAKKFVNKVLETTEERKRTIENGLRNAEEAQTLKAEKLKEAEQEKQSLISDAYKQAGDIVQHAKSKESQIVEEANTKAQQIIVDAGKELEDLKVKSKNEGLSEAREVISTVVKKSFEGLSIDDKTEEKLVEDALKQVK
jgi:F0F1-type ATP synthase membrane subunit b/b'